MNSFRKTIATLLAALLLCQGAIGQQIGPSGGGSSAAPGTSGQLIANVAGVLTGIWNVFVGNGGKNVTQRLPTISDDWTKGYFGDGAIDNLYLSNGPITGCTGTPTFTIAAPAGTGGVAATGHFAMTASSGGNIVAPVIDIPGNGYNTNPTVTVSNYAGCSGTPAVTAYYTPNGQFWLGPDNNIYQAHQANTGNAVWSIFPAPSLPLDSVVNAATAVTKVAGGSGYTTGQTITIANGTVVTITASGGAVTSAVVTTPGNWQCYTAATQSQVSSSGGGTGATFTVTANWPPAAYGNHLLTTCYTANKAADITRASDSTTATIGFVNQVLDVSTMQQFCAGTTCTWAKVYDQSGHQNDAPGTGVIVDFNQNLNGIPIWFNNYFTIPSGIAYNPVNGMTVYDLTAAEEEANNGLIMFAAGVEPIFHSGYNLAFQSPPGYYNTYTNYLPSYQTELIGGSINSGSSAEFSIDDFEIPCIGTCTGSLASTGGYVGYTAASGLASSMFVMYTRAFSTAEVASFRASVYKTFKVYPQVRDIMVSTGDSRTLGLASTNNVNYEVQINPLLSAPFRIFNTGTSGDTAANRLTNFYTQDAPLLLLPHGPNSMLSMWIGYNDLQASIAPGTIYSTMTTYISEAHALGEKVAYTTETEGGTTTLTAYNALILANTAGADYVPNMGADPVWAGGYTSQTVYGSGPHPSTFGYGIVASDLANGLNPLLK